MSINRRPNGMINCQGNWVSRNLARTAGLPVLRAALRRRTSSAEIHLSRALRPNPPGSATGSCLGDRFGPSGDPTEGPCCSERMFRAEPTVRDAAECCASSRRGLLRLFGALRLRAFGEWWRVTNTGGQRAVEFLPPVGDVAAGAVDVHLEPAFFHDRSFGAPHSTTAFLDSGRFRLNWRESS